MSRTIPSALRAIAMRQNSVMKIAKRLATPILQRLDIIVPVRLAGGDILYVDLANAVGRTIWLRKDYVSERPITALIQETLKPGDVFFDVGANVGFFSLVASRAVGMNGAVHAFEPLPELVSLLRGTVSVNHLTNLSIIEAAVGDRPGIAEMAAMKDSSYSHMLEGATHVEAERGGWHSMSVKTVTLDDYVERLVRKRPRLIKMDIEGAELGAVAGARSLLSDPAGPDVVCEVGESQLARFGHHPKDVFGIFESMGYESLDPQSGRNMKVEDLSIYQYNVFFKKRSR